ncbi:uncharacterized protein LOC108595928 [Drosophila busckii]|uniref:uncharacterized protein LOC108595928 n=1 Tax=Drosophila busckii TaxID=30019 RepID=UPI00083F37C9|nr:uncharacterized protein LOC108595928 [Drosophila busckii]
MAHKLLIVLWVLLLQRLGHTQSQQQSQQQSQLVACNFDSLTLRDDMLEFTGQLVLKQSQALLLAASKIFDMINDELSYMAVGNPALRMRLKLLAEHVAAIEQSQLLQLHKLSSAADLSTLAHFYDRRVALPANATAAVLPQLARLCNNVLNALRSKTVQLSLEDELLANAMRGTGWPFVRNVMRIELAKFFEDYFAAHSADAHYQCAPQALSCRGERLFLTYYNELRTAPTDTDRLERALVWSFRVLNVSYKTNFKFV